VRFVLDVIAACFLFSLRFQRNNRKHLTHHISFCLVYFSSGRFFDKMMKQHKMSAVPSERCENGREEIADYMQI
jgi:lipopolysaccharide export LptBFGC system permease protein LptF